MRSLILIGLGFLMGAAALGVVWATSGDRDGAVDVRIVAERLDDGRVEVGLQQRQESGDWSETEKPSHRFVPPDVEVGKPLHSSTLVVDTVSREESVAADYAAYLFQSGEEVGTRFIERFESEAELPKLLCVEDRNDPGIGSLCDGVESAYAGDVERVGVADYGAFRSQLEARVGADRDFGGLFATSVPLANIVDEVLETADTRPRWSYWIELIDPHLPASDQRYCVISHGGEDLFWGLSSEASVAAAGVLGINMRSESYAAASDQAEAIRRCVDEGAAAIATTLAEPDALEAAIGEAHAAGIPVLSFNSGAEVAADLGTALHISLDDREAGRIAGEEFNQRGIEGHALCVMHEPNNSGLLDRCAGLAEGFAGTVERWSPSGPTELAAELQTRLEAGDVSAVLGLSSSSGRAVRRAVYRSELEISAATFGWSRSIAELVADGRLMFAILDHPELQSYLAAVGALVVERLRLDPAGYFNGAQLLIGPKVVGAEEMQTLLDSLVRQETQP